MYSKILKETASQLTLLIAGNNGSDWDGLEKSLSGFFKTIYHAGNLEDSLALFRQEPFDLVLVDIDAFSGDALSLIDEIKKGCELQVSIAVYGANSNDSGLLFELLNANIAGFIKKDSTSDEMHKALALICDRALDKKVMHAYIREMEDLCRSFAYTKAERSACPVQAEDSFFVAQPQMPMILAETGDDEDDFEFFPTPSAIAAVQREETAIYQDYFSYLEFDDREELHDLLGDIDASLLSAFSDRGGDAVYITRLGTLLMRYGNVLLHYQFFGDMGTSILEFGKMISDESESIAVRSDDFELLISGFCSGLQTFMVEVWDKNSDNPKFFNDSIINDAATIMGMIAPVEHNAGDDDLFFF